MAVAAQSPIFQSMESETSKSRAVDMASTSQGLPYWWSTSGRDLANMLHEANYPEEVQRHFLSYYRDIICPRLGGQPGEDSVKSGVGWDGNPLEYSFELKGTTKTQAVRFVVDLTQLRPADRSSPLSMDTTQKVVDMMADKAPGFDENWSKSLQRWFVYDHLSEDEQKALIAKAGQQTSVILGFDIFKRVAGPDGLPVMAKVYYPPCYTAAAKGITRWQAVRQGIQQLPGVSSYPNILKSTEIINDYLSDKPREWQMGTRYLATDLVGPEKARMKVYMRCFGRTFDDIWDYYTLGGRITGVEEDKEKFRDMMNFVSGTNNYDAEISKQDPLDETRYRSATGKLTAIYFSISADNPIPAPKLCIYPANFAPNDEVIAKGLDKWLTKYGWHHEGASMEEQVKRVFDHRPLGKKTGIFTFIGIGRKEDPTSKDLSIQVYVTPELYETPRY
ncbi:MAG: hypothetical protein Q9157_001157 [Trypethelium eluteriae]